MLKFILFALLLAPPAFTEPNNIFIETLRPFSDDIRTWISTIGRDGSVSSSVGIQAEYFGCDLCSILIPLVSIALDTYSVAQLKGMVVTACQILDLAPQPEVCKPIVDSYAVSQYLS